MQIEQALRFINKSRAGINKKEIQSIITETSKQDKISISRIRARGTNRKKHNSNKNSLNIIKTIMTPEIKTKEGHLIIKNKNKQDKKRGGKNKQTNKITSRAIITQIKSPQPYN